MRRRAEGQRSVQLVTASDLLARPDVVPAAPVPGGEDPVPASLLIDLYANRLIITDDYVGPERRPITRDSEDGGPEQPTRPSRFPRHPRRSGGAPSLRPWHLVAAVALTTLIVAPLTLELTRPPAPGTPPRPSPAATATARATAPHPGAVTPKDTGPPGNH